MCLRIVPFDRLVPHPENLTPSVLGIAIQIHSDPDYDKAVTEVKRMNEWMKYLWKQSNIIMWSAFTSECVLAYNSHYIVNGC